MPQKKSGWFEKIKTVLNRFKDALVFFFFYVKIIVQYINDDSLIGRKDSTPLRLTQRPQLVWQWTI